MGVTIKQIAQIAGVHRSTVDKVLHKRDGVSDIVREKVQKIIDDCEYQANPIGKALKMQEKEICIGVLLLQVDALEYLKGGILQGLEKYDSFNIKVYFEEIPYSDVAGQVEKIKSYVNQKVDGIILNAVNANDIVKEIAVCHQKNIPVITVNSDVGASDRICFIGQDGYKAGKIAGRLMGAFLGGRGKVAVFTSDGDQTKSFPFGTREAGFREVIQDAYSQVTVLPSITTNENPKIVSEKARELLEKHENIAGIFITCGCVRDVGEVLKVYNRRNVKFICYENYPDILNLMKEDIVDLTLDSGLAEQGRRSMELLLDCLIYDRKPESEYLYSENKILVKESL